MARQHGRNAFTVQEATNSQAYYDYKQQNVTINATSIGSGDETADWANNPAKEFTITKVSGDDANTVTFQLKIAGSYGDSITYLLSEFPVTIDKILVDQIRFATSDTGTDEVVKILSFH
tara:strand:- start:149 stop:505 length:357 start_codon:yes stop_codon:yes gene_type:complete